MKTASKILLGVIGALLLVTGLICIFNPTGAVTSVAWLVGVVLLVSGIATAVFYFAFGGFLIFSLPVLLNAIGDIVFGVIFLQHPDGTSRVFTVVYGLLLIGTGILAAVIAAVARKFVENKGLFTGVLLFGLAAIVVGIIALASDTFGAVLVAIPVGLALVAMGAGYIALDVHLIKAQKNGTETKYFKDVTD